MQPTAFELGIGDEPLDARHGLEHAQEARRVQVVDELQRARAHLRLVTGREISPRAVGEALPVDRVGARELRQHEVQRFRRKEIVDHDVGEGVRHRIAGR
jgi:hypothetical protein